MRMPIFQILDFAFIEGAGEEALTAPDAIVITDEMAKNYSADEPALGKAALHHNEKTLQVKGVVKKRRDTRL